MEIDWCSGFAHVRPTNIINMLSDVTITEVSLSLEVTVPPKLCVNVQIPYAVSTLGTETERVIQADKLDQTPNEVVRKELFRAASLTEQSGRIKPGFDASKAWIKDPQPDTMRLVYSSPLQDVECSYSKATSTMTLYGIKYKNVELFNGHVHNLLALLKTEPAGTPVTRYKAVAKRNMLTEWDQNILADIITNDPDMAQVIAVCEKTSTLCERRLFSVAIASDRETNPHHLRSWGCRVALTHRGNTVHAMMSKLCDEEDATYAAGVLERLFRLYEDHYFLCRLTVSRGLVAHKIFKENFTEPGIPVKQSEILPDCFVSAAARESGMKDCQQSSPKGFAGAAQAEPGIPVKQSERMKDCQRSSPKGFAGVAQAEPVRVATDNGVSEIENLRSVFPELFVNNYTRECPVLPIILSAEETERVRHTKRVIKYFDMYFTAPEGYSVGLKRNRLSNMNVFPCLVTCYLHDHMLRRGSETFKYYNAPNEVVLKERTSGAHSQEVVGFHDIEVNGFGEGRESVISHKKRPLPKCIQDPNYHRIKAESFVNAVESATGVKINRFKWYPHIARQELWDKSDDEIMDTIKYGPGSLTFRYFEEAIRVSIHVVVIQDGNFESLIPRHKGKYVWSPPYPLHVVIFETYRTTYGRKHCSYDYLAKGKETLFDDQDSVVTDLTVQKNAGSIRAAPIDEGTISEQTIDRNGKCSLVRTEQNSTATYTRPLAVPVTCEPRCFFDRHIHKLNRAKLEMGLDPIDASKRSTNDLLYFPNDESYVFFSKNVGHPAVLQR